MPQELGRGGGQSLNDLFWTTFLDHVAFFAAANKDLLTGAMDVYLSMVSNRLNLVVERLTVLSTILLPLIVLTGFFGQNFGWMVRHVGSWETFVLLGLLLPVVAATLLVLWLASR